MAKKYDFDFIVHPKGETFFLGWGLQRKPTVIRHKYWVYPKPDAVTISRSLYYMGKSKNDKTYARWANDGSWTIKRMPSGKYVVLSKNNGRFLSGITYLRPSWFDAVPEEGKQFIRTSVAMIGVVNHGDAYPALKIFEPKTIFDYSYGVSEMAVRYANRFGDGKISRIPTRRLYAALHNDDPRQLIEMVTGHTYRKDIARAIEGKPLEVISALRDLEHVDASWIEDLMRDRGESEIRRILGGAQTLKSMHRDGELTDAMYKRFLLGDAPDGGLWANDTRRMVHRMFADKKARKEFLRPFADLNEAHRATIAAYNEMFPVVARPAYVADYWGNVDYTATTSVDLTKPIEYSDSVKTLDGAIVDEYTILLPKIAREIAEWSPVMRHCIGGYAERAYKGEVLGAVMQGDKMAANFQLAPKSSMNLAIYDGDGNVTTSTMDRGPLVMSQIYGKANSMFDDADKIHDFMVASGVIEASAHVSGIRRNVGREILAGAVRAVENGDQYAEYREFMRQQRGIERAGADAYVQFDMPARNLGGVRIQNNVPENWNYIRAEQNVGQLPLRPLQLSNIF